MSIKKPNLGFGLGLRLDHYETIINEKPAIDWFEIITENYLGSGGKPLYFLDKIREHYPMVMHGVSLSIGSCDPIDFDYLSQVKQLASKVQPAWISDHLCFTGVNHKNTHDLLPLPYTNEMINHVVSRINAVQEYLGRQILIENVSSYITYQQSEMTEWEFIAEISHRSDCLILFDVNNVYVSSRNHEFNPMDYVNAMPTERLYQIHLAGHEDHGDYIIDTHDHDIVNSVWNLYQKTIEKHGFISTMIERDDHIPPLNDLLNELDRAKKIAEAVEKNIEILT